MPIGLIASPDRLSPAAKFERQKSGKGQPEDAAAGDGTHQAATLKAAAAREEAGKDLIAAFIANDTVLPSPTKGPRPAAPASAAGNSCPPAPAGKGSSDAPPLPLKAAETSSGGSTAQVEVMCVDASLSAAPTSLAAAAPTTQPAVLTAAGSPACSPQAAPKAACPPLAFTLAPALAGMGGHPVSSPAVPLPPAPAPLPQASTAASPSPGAPQRSIRSLSKRFSRSMRKLGASLRRHMRRQDSPPVPRSLSRALGVAGSSRRSPAAAASHMPSISEGGPAAAAAAAVAATALLPAELAVVAAAPTGDVAGDVAGGSMEEVELGPGAAAASAARAPPRRFASLRSCACFAAPMH